jgi:hypothetical protein
MKSAIENPQVRIDYLRARLMSLTSHIEKLEAEIDKGNLDTRKPLVKILQIVQGECMTGPCTHPDAVLIAEVANEALGDGMEKELYVADKPSHRRKA